MTSAAGCPPHVTPVRGPVAGTAANPEDIFQTENGHGNE